MGLLLLVLLILLIVGALPNHTYSREWGYAPSGVLGLVLLIVLILILMGHVPVVWYPHPGPVVVP